MNLRSILVALFVILPVAALHAQQTTRGGLPGAEAWHLPTEDEKTELFIYEIGTGDPVVVLHGGPGGEFTPLLTIANGLEDSFRFIFYDQRGSLRSPTSREHISMANHVADLEQLRTALGVPRIAIISHSAGTMLAYEYLKAFPDRVGNLVLVGALPHKNGKKYFDEHYASLWSTTPEDAKRFNEREGIDAEIRRAGLDVPNPTPKQQAQIRLIRQVAGNLVHIGRWREWLPMRVALAAAEATRDTTNFVYDHGPLLARHPHPVTVINGEHDYIVGPRNSPLWRHLQATEAPNIRVAVIENAAHMPWEDDPVEFGEELRRALAR